MFAGLTGQAIMADQDEIQGFAHFLDRYKKGLDIEKAAIDVVDW
ncbi:MAG: hypothetical protein ACSW8A_02420 [Lachnospiraceae bacterium]